MRRLSALVIVFSLLTASAGFADSITAGIGFNVYAGMFTGSSDMTHGINPNLTLSTSGLPYDADMTFCLYDERRGMVLPTVFAMEAFWDALWSDPKDLKLSDGTLIPATESDNKISNPFEYWDFGFEMSYIPVTLTLVEGKDKDSGVFLSPKIGFASNFLDHTFKLVMTPFNGKTGTPSAYGDDYYYGSIGPDLYGVVLGAYLQAFKIFRFDFGLTYLPLGPLMASPPSLGSSWYDHSPSLGPDGDAGDVSADSMNLLRVKLNAACYILYPVHFDARLIWNSFTVNGYKPVSFYSGAFKITDKTSISVSDLMIIFGIGITL